MGAGLSGYRVPCGHPGCLRSARGVVAWEAPDHVDFHGQTHDCCMGHGTA